MVARSIALFLALLLSPFERLFSLSVQHAWQASLTITQLAYDYDLGVHALKHSLRSLHDQDLVQARGGLSVRERAQSYWSNSWWQRVEVWEQFEPLFAERMANIAIELTKQPDAERCSYDCEKRIKQLAYDLAVQGMLLTVPTPDPASDMEGFDIERFLVELRLPDLQHGSEGLRGFLRSLVWGSKFSVDYLPRMISWGMALYGFYVTSGLINQQVIQTNNAFDAQDATVNLMLKKLIHAGKTVSPQDLEKQIDQLHGAGILARKQSIQSIGALLSKALWFPVWSSLVGVGCTIYQLLQQSDIAAKNRLFDMIARTSAAQKKGKYTAFERYGQVFEQYPLLAARYRQVAHALSDGLANSLKARALGTFIDCHGLIIEGAGAISLARAIAGESERPCLQVSAPALLLRADGMEKLRRVFRKAQLIAPCVIVINELDFIAAPGDNTLRANFLALLVAEIDALNKHNSYRPVMVIGTTGLGKNINASLYEGRRLMYMPEAAL